MDTPTLINGFYAIGVLTFCFGVLRYSNGRLSKKVDRETCHTAQKAVNKRIDDFEEHFHQRIDDLKDLIKKNGRDQL